MTSEWVAWRAASYMLYAHLGYYPSLCSCMQCKQSFWMHSAVYLLKCKLKKHRIKAPWFSYDYFTYYAKINFPQNFFRWYFLNSLKDWKCQISYKKWGKKKYEWDRQTKAINGPKLTDCLEYFFYFLILEYMYRTLLTFLYLETHSDKTSWNGNNWC